MLKTRQAMKSISKKLESSLIRIFRFFSGGLAIVFLLLKIAPAPWGTMIR